jgi:hypothetical protein
MRQSLALRPLLGVALASACVLLQSCGRSDPPPPPDILKTQREALEKAKGAEKMLQDAAQKREVQVQSQEK